MSRVSRIVDREPCAVKTYINWSAAAHNLFIVQGGPVKVTFIGGLVKATIRNLTMNMQLNHTTVAPVGVVALASNVDIDNDAVGTAYTLNATFGGALVATTAGCLEHVGDPFIAPIGTISFTSGAIENGAGSIEWLIRWEPLSPNAVVVPAVTN